MPCLGLHDAQRGRRQRDKDARWSSLGQVVPFCPFPSLTFHVEYKLSMLENARRLSPIQIIDPPLSFRRSVATRNLLLPEEHKKQIPRFALNDRPWGILHAHCWAEAHVTLSRRRIGCAPLRSPHSRRTCSRAGSEAEKVDLFRKAKTPRSLRMVSLGAQQWLHRELDVPSVLK